MYTKFGLLFFLSTIFFASLVGAFQLGFQRTYSLDNILEINDVGGSTDSIGYKLTGSVRVGTLWGNDNEKILKFDLLTPNLHVKPSDNRKNYGLIQSTLQSAKNEPFYAYWTLGKITKIYANPDEEISILNLKRGIISLFQYQLLDGNFIEEDVSGLCNVEYESKSSTKYFKTKNNCKTSSDLDIHSRHEETLGYYIKSSRKTEYFVTSEGIIDKVDCREYFKTYLTSNQNVGSTIESLLNLRFDGSISNIETLSAESLDDAVKHLVNVKEMSLEAQQEVENEGKTSLIKLIKEYKKDLKNENVGKKKLALALVKIIHNVRNSKIEEYVRILNAQSTKEIKGQLLDILAAAQTIEAHEAVKKAFDFKTEKDAALFERYLQGLSVGTRPKMEVIEDFLRLSNEKLKSDAVADTLIQTIASMGQRFARLPGKSYEDVKNVESFLVTSLSSCKKDTCKLRYIRGLQNFQSPTTIPNLFKHALNGDRLVSVASVKALSTFSTNNWTKEMKANFENIFYQKTKRFDSSARTISLDILFELRPEMNDLKYMFEFLKSSDKSYEVKQYLLQRFRMMSDVCPLFRSKINQILKSDPTLNNYHILGQRGLSTALSRSFSKSPSFNASLISIQEMHGGVLKRGIVDMVLEADNNKFSVFSLGMYAGGLSSFIGGGGSDETESEEESATAGMELIVQGSYLRPLEFFNGQGELMGHVWSGTASDRTPAYQATTLLQDHYEHIRLQNGAIVTFKIIGAVSIDLNGQVKFSLWNRNANSKVEKNTAFVVIGKISLRTSFVNLLSQFTVTQEPKLNLESQIDFSSDIMLCMQLSQPKTVLKHNIVKTERVPSAKHNVKYIINHKYNLPGYTHALNQKNNEMCNSIFG